MFAKYYVLLMHQAQRLHEMQDFFLVRFLFSQNISLYMWHKLSAMWSICCHLSVRRSSIVEGHCVGGFTETPKTHATTLYSSQLKEESLNIHILNRHEHFMLVINRHQVQAISCETKGIQSVQLSSQHLRYFNILLICLNKSFYYDLVLLVVTDILDVVLIIAFYVILTTV